jgi:ATP adenylyltransferase
MRRLWAPWRAEYIYCAGGHRPSRDRRHCLFCRLLAEKDDNANLVLCRGRRAFAVMNRFPYNNGHLMVAPTRHVAPLEKLGPAEMRAVMELVQRALVALRGAFRPHGFNIGANLGQVAGAGVAGHVHLHVVPRWQGDSNFMPLLAETKVVSEHLAATYARLLPRFGRARTTTKGTKAGSRRRRYLEGARDD